MESSQDVRSPDRCWEVVSVSRAKARLLDEVRAFGGDTLRDLHVFTDATYETLYLRDDVREQLADIDVPKYMDNERYGYVTRDTYEGLTYAEYRYTVRGFDQFEQFRTFVGADRTVGLLASFDQADSRDWLSLQESLDDVVAELGIDGLRPETERVGEE
ncbi:MAG: hypothetical protein ABEJ35_02650 [Halobacteriaceae archaeon]